MKKLITTICILASLNLMSQDGAESSMTSDPEAIDKVAFVPSGASSVSNPISNVRFTSNKGESNVAVNMGFLIFDKLSGNVEVSSPTAKSGATKPIGLDGLANDGKLTFGLQFKSWKALTSTQIVNALNGYKNKADATKAANSFLDLSDADKAKVLQNLRNNKTLKAPWFVGATVTITKNEFSYASDSTLSTILDEEKRAVSFSGYIGTYLGVKLNTLVRVVYLHKNSFQGNSTNDFFIPFAGGSTLVKRTLAIGEPSETSSNELKIENVTAFGKHKWGINPSLTFLTDSEEVSIDFPIYFINGKAKDKVLGLNTGVFINYTTGLDDPLTAGVFVGTSLTEILRPN